MRANLITDERQAATAATQRTPKGLEIPVPKRRDVLNPLRKLVQPPRKS